MRSFYAYTTLWGEKRTLDPMVDRLDLQMDRQIMCSGCGQVGMWSPHDPTCPLPEPNWIGINERWMVNRDSVSRETYAAISEYFQQLLAERKAS